MNIDHHDIHGPREQSQLLVQVVAGNGHSLAHQYLVGSATNARNIDAFGAGGFRLLLELWISAGSDDHLRQNWLVAVA